MPKKRKHHFCVYMGCGEEVYHNRGLWHHVKGELDKDHPPRVTLYDCRKCGDPIMRVRFDNFWPYQHYSGDEYYDHPAGFPFDRGMMEDMIDSMLTNGNQLCSPKNIYEILNHD